MRRRRTKGPIREIRHGSQPAGGDSGRHLRGRSVLHLAAQFAAAAAAIALLAALFFAGGYPPAGKQASAATLPACTTFGPEAAVAAWPNTWCVTESGHAVYYELKMRDGDCIEARTMRISRFFDPQDAQVATRLDVEPWACVSHAPRWQDRG